MGDASLTSSAAVIIPTATHSVFWVFFVFFIIIISCISAHCKRLEHMVSSITESLADHAGPQKQECLLRSCSWTLHSVDRHFWRERDSKQNRGLGAEPGSVPPSVAPSYIAPPAAKCNHFFYARGASVPVRKRLYQIPTRCHYPARVVSTPHLQPLECSRCTLKTKKRMLVAARVLWITGESHGSFRRRVLNFIWWLYDHNM